MATGEAFAAPATEKQVKKFKNNPSLKMCMKNVNRDIQNVKDDKGHGIVQCIHDKYGWISYKDYSKLINAEMQALHAKEKAGFYKYINEAFAVLPDSVKKE